MVVYCLCNSRLGVQHQNNELQIDTRPDDSHWHFVAPKSEFVKGESENHSRS